MAESVLEGKRHFDCDECGQPIHGWLSVDEAWTSKELQAARSEAVHGKQMCRSCDFMALHQRSLRLRQ